MHEYRRLLLPSLALAALIALGWWLTSPRDPEPPAGVAEPAAERPLYLVTDARFHRFDATGRLVSRLDSPRVSFIESEQRWYLTRPVWQRRVPEAEVRWEGRSEQGTLRGDRSVGTLTGDVELQRIGPKETITLETERLRIRPGEGYAETDAEVTIAGADWLLNGIGARAWLDSQRMEVLNDVTTRYDVSAR
jgi:lipopolysaccharide export system protein LptC